MSDDKIRVLIVDDEQAHARAVAESLERTGYECAVATSGADGIHKIETEDFDIVITDLVMGPIDGLAVLKSLERLTYYGRHSVASRHTKHLKPFQALFYDLSC